MDCPPWPDSIRRGLAARRAAAATRASWPSCSITVFNKRTAHDHSVGQIRPGAGRLPAWILRNPRPPADRRSALMAETVRGQFLGNRRFRTGDAGPGHGVHKPPAGPDDLFASRSAGVVGAIMKMVSMPCRRPPLPPFIGLFQRQIRNDDAGHARFPRLGGKMSPPQAEHGIVHRS